MLKLWTVQITTNWKILKEIGIPDYLTCPEKPVCEAIVGARHGTMNWFQPGKRVCQDCILSPFLFNFYTDCIMQNTRLDESQARTKITGGNINSLRHADNTTLMAESEEELKSLLMRMKEE